jgi:capsular polysaccharide export protein
MPQDAQITLARIHKWRKKGGKIACAFGKVVCDSGVPYDGGPAHANMREWINHTIESVKGSDTLLLIKPHPHELKEEIACYLNETFLDLIDQPLPENVIYLGHRWFDIHALKGFVDFGLIYNGTTAVELGVLDIPSVLCSSYAPIDYPVGHATPKNQAHYRKMVRGEIKLDVSEDLRKRAAFWLYYMNGASVTRNYRYHARQITNKFIYPSWWFKKDISSYFIQGDPEVTALAKTPFIEKQLKNGIGE